MGEHFMQHIGKTTINALFFYCTAEMGGGVCGKEALASAVGKKRRLPMPEKYQCWHCAWGYFFG